MPNVMDAVRSATRSLEEFLEACGVDAELRFAMTLALEEVVTNVIKYSYGDDARHEIGLEARLEPEATVLQISDEGREYDPRGAEAPDFAKPHEDRAIGGLGVHLLRNLTERIEYHRAAGGNVLKLFFKGHKPRD
jgi:anti-sigma regulatory factor (Ser/Thr protein kinase)